MFLTCDRLHLKLQHQFQFWYSPLTLKLIAQSAIAFCLLISGKASAQVIPDNTLPQNSIVAPNSDIIEITGGTTQGNNLFHSFEQFSILNGQTAGFDNAAAIANIISRVTGGSISEIDGLIQANGTANLFLINPNGIIFGENAALDLGGSFIGSTADSLKFADGTEFSAVNPNANPLLTVSIPTGLQYGGEKGDITVEGSGNNLFIDFDTFTVDRNDRPVGLSVESGKTLALVGGNVFVEGGNLTAPQGNIELGSVAGEGTVTLTPDSLGWKLGYESVNNFQEIGLSQAASLEASGNSGGRVRVQGDYISLTDGSAILTDTLGDGSGGSLIVEGNETEIYGVAENGFTSSLFTNVDLGATGDGGDALIDTGYLYIGDGAQVNVNTFGLGDAGTLTVIADEIEILGGSVDGEFPSGLFAQADIGQTGKGGDIYVEADYLLVADGAEINVNTFGDGDAGNLRVQANEIELIAGSSDFGSSGLVANADFDSTGNGGNLEIDTGYLYIADGAQAIASTFGEGDAGNLTISADVIELIGTSPNGIPSGLFGTADLETSGNGGNLQINSTNLLINDGAQIAVSTAGLGNGGILDIDASNVELIGSSEFGSSGLFSNAIIGSGNGGDINLSSDRLSITDGATISAGNFASNNPDIPPGTGKAGNININVDLLELDSTIADEFSSITASTNSLGGGNITLNVDSGISLSNRSQITSETRSEGDGGKIELTADTLELKSNGLFSTNTEASGNAGSINLNINRANISGSGSGIFSEVRETATGEGGSIAIFGNEFNLNNQGQVSVNSTGLGQAGNISIVSDTLNLNEGKITANSTQTGGGDISLVTDSIFLNNNSLISTSVTDSTGGGGNIFIDNSDFIIGQNNSKIEADAVLGKGGNIEIKSTGIFFDVPLEDAITASSKFGRDGVIDINNTESDKKLGTVQLPNNIDAPEAVIVSSCPVPDTNTFVVLGKGGIPENPELYLRGQALWQDLRMFTEKNTKLSSNSLPISKYPQKSALIEAQTWKVNPQGNVELITNNSTGVRNAIASNHAQSYFSHNFDSCSQSMTNYRSTFISQDKFSY